MDIDARGHPLWWKVAQDTIDHFTCVRFKIFGDRNVDDDSTEILCQARDHRSSETDPPVSDPAA